MMNKIHVYAQRHVFLDDDHIGKWSVPEKTVRLRPEYAGEVDRVKAWFMRTHGLPAKVLVGDETFNEKSPLMEFPEHIRELMTPFLGDLTPAAVAYAREHFPAEEFKRRYDGRVADAGPALLIDDHAEVLHPTDAADALGDAAEASNTPPVEVLEPKKRGRKPKALKDLEDAIPDED